MDVLNRMFPQSIERGHTGGLFIGQDSVEFSDLQFADDIILFLPKDKDNFLNVLSLLQIFESVSML